jgi:hypothetical protein
VNTYSQHLIHCLGITQIPVQRCLHLKDELNRHSSVRSPIIPHSHMTPTREPVKPFLIHHGSSESLSLTSFLPTTLILYLFQLMPQSELGVMHLHCVHPLLGPTELWTHYPVTLPQVGLFCSASPYRPSSSSIVLHLTAQHKIHIWLTRRKHILSTFDPLSGHYINPCQKMPAPQGWLK